MTTMESPIDFIKIRKNILKAIQDNNYDNLILPNSFDIANLVDDNKIRLYDTIFTIIKLDNCPESLHINNKMVFNWKQKYYYKLFEYLVIHYDLIWFNIDTPPVYSNYSNMLENLTKLNKGQYLLNRIIKSKIHKKNQEKIDNASKSFLEVASSYGTFPTFLFWLNYLKTQVEDLPYAFQKGILYRSISNSDDRIYYHLLNTILGNDKLFLQKNSNVIETIIENFSSNTTIPTKYILRRLKGLSEKISLIPYFDNLINRFTDIKIISKILKYYYVNPIKFKQIESISIIYNVIEYSSNWDISDNDDITLSNNYNVVKEILKTDEEKQMLDLYIYLSSGININEWSTKLLENIIKKEYTDIIEVIKLDKVFDQELGQWIMSYLCNNNLITKYLSEKKTLNYNIKLYFYSRYLVLELNSKSVVFKQVISINRFLSLLRIKAKKIVNKRNIEQKVKTWNLMKEITSFAPKFSIPVLSKGSINWQLKQHKFNDIPPRHVLPGELEYILNKEIILRDKADGILINNLPVGIYPKVDKIHHYKVKAEYMDEIDLYLVFDVDLPNSDYITRYEFLRGLHLSTNQFNKLETVNSYEEWFAILLRERQMINDVMNQNQDKELKWYPKFGCLTRVK